MEILDRSRLVVVVGVTGVVAAAVLLAMAGAPWAGPVLLTLVPDHGLEVADLAAVVAAAVVLRAVRRRTSPASAIVAGDVSWWMRAAVVVAAVGIAVEGGLSLAEADRGVPLVPYAVLVVLVAAVLVAVGCWLAVPARPGRDLGTSGSRGVGLVAPAVLALAVGTAVDLAVLPTGTLFGVSLVAVVLAVAGREGPGRRAVLVVLGVTGVLLSVASLADLVGIDVVMSTDQGGAARAVLLGLVVATVALPLPGRRAAAPGRHPG